jgi:hypothetical protein
MLKNILLALLLTLSALHASEVRVDSFTALNKDNQRKALIALSVDSVENFLATISGADEKLHKSDNCKLSVALFFQERLKQLSSTTNQNPLAHLLSRYNADNEDFGSYFSKGKLSILAHDISSCCIHIKGNSTSVATHLLGLHKFASFIVDDACQWNQYDQEQNFAQWLSEKIHAVDGVIDTELVRKVNILAEKAMIIKK